MDDNLAPMPASSQTSPDEDSRTEDRIRQKMMAVEFGEVYDDAPSYDERTTTRRRNESGIDSEDDSKPDALNLSSHDTEVKETYGTQTPSHRAAEEEIHFEQILPGAHQIHRRGQHEENENVQAASLSSIRDKGEACAKKDSFLVPDNIAGEALFAAHLVDKEAEKIHEEEFEELRHNHEEQANKIRDLEMRLAEIEPDANVQVVLEIQDPFSGDHRRDPYGGIIAVMLELLVVVVVVALPLHN